MTRRDGPSKPVLPSRSDAIHVNNKTHRATNKEELLKIPVQEGQQQVQMVKKFRLRNGTKIGG